MAETNLLAQELIQALNEATLAIAQAERLDVVLQAIADHARQVMTAQYAAIGLPAADRSMQTFVFSGISPEEVARMPHLPKGLGLLGELLRGEKAVRIADIAQDPRAGGFPSSHVAMKAFLGVPIRLNEQAIGSLYLTNKVGGEGFTAVDQQLAEILAAHAGIAIHKAVLLGQSADYSHRLEHRNRQLAALNEAAMAVVSQLSLQKVLQQIVNSVRDLVGAQYAALGVPNNEGALENFIYSGLEPEEAALIDHLPKGLGLLAAIIREKRAIRIPDISRDPRSVGLPEGHPAMSAFLGVPILIQEDLVGNLYLTNKIQGAEFTHEDQELVELLAAHAAIAIQNARLYEQVGRLAIVEERNRIGMDLHDGIIQSIYAVGLTLESTRLALPENAEDADHLLEIAIDGLNNTIRDIRNFILDLRPHRFKGDLQEGLSRLVREFQANTMIHVTQVVPLEAVSGLPTSVSRTLFLTSQEALANVARHARAKTVFLEVSRELTAVTLSIRDDGKGFDTSRPNYSIGHGLSNMRARAEDLHGTFTLNSAPGQGTQISLTLPYR